MAEKSPFSNRIKILPPLDSTSEEHPETFAALDAFVLPSRHEPFGIVILEAWAANKPVIVSGVGGLEQLVDDNIQGLKVGCGEPERLADAMLKLIREPETRMRLGSAGRQKVEEQYTWKQVGNQLEYIHSKVLEPYEWDSPKAVSIVMRSRWPMKRGQSERPYRL